MLPFYLESSLDKWRRQFFHRVFFVVQILFFKSDLFIK